MTAHKKPAKATKTRGTKAKQDEHALCSPLKSRILALAKSALAKSENAKSLASDAVHDAHECGKLLLAEKVWLIEVRDDAREKLKLLKENNQPATEQELFWRDADWNTWYESQYSKDIPPEVSDRFTKLARAHENQETFAFDKSPNLMRSGLLALQIYPQKLHEPIEGDVRIAAPASHLAIVNRFVLWHKTWKTKHRGAMTLDERARLISDFAPILSFVEELLHKS